MKRTILFLLAAAIANTYSIAQDTTSVDNLSNDISLEDLMKVTVTVASQNATSIRETPGSITVITDDDIKKSGARDLNELLMRVPGFDLGRDYGSSLSFGVRGIWGMEGKILFLIDGQNMNETNYGSFPTGNRVPLNQIKRIEIIRGPGSVIYGGVAGLAVVSIITKTGEEMNGASVKGGYAYSDGATSSKSGEFNGGFKYKKLDLSVHAGWNNSNISNMKVNYWDAYPVNYRDSSGQKSYMINVGLRYSGLTLRFINEDYQTQRTFENYYTKGNLVTRHGGIYLGADYKWKVSEKIQIVPAVQWKQIQPWNVQGDSANEAAKIIANRLQSSLKVNYKITNRFNVMVGSEYYQLDSRYANNYDTTMMFKYTKKTTMQLANIAGFAEIVYNSNYGNVILGGRYDNHSVAGQSFVPRLAYTKAWNRAHVKATYSQAFKAPVIQNIELNSKLNPERIQMVELEGGVKLTKQTYLTVNLYDSRINGTYVYKQVDSSYFYTNGGKIGTHGVETQLQWTSSRLNIKLTHAYYSAFRNEVTSYTLTNNAKMLMAFPSNKISGNIWVKLGSKFYASTNILWMSKRRSYAYDVNYEFKEYTMNSVFIWNVYVGGKDLLAKGLSLDLGVSDLLNSQIKVGMPYSDGLNYIPLQRRELQCRLTYDLKLRK